MSFTFRPLRSIHSLTSPLLPQKSLLRPLSVRPFSSTTLRPNPNQASSSSPTSQSPSTKDPSHPYLYYHPTHTHLTLSFLPSPPIQKSRTILGYLPLENATLEDFKEEPKFIETLHDAIQSGLEANVSDTLQYEAETRPTDGWIHITDERAIPPAGRIGETEDLIGSVYVQEGKIIASTYSPLPTYRLITPNGVLTLPKGLDTHLIKVLEKIDQEEKK
ncbi:uncharacterized protein I303_102057 [Kwoniella dejecticola CBS 10117]|uniref:Uncharacterized protein n=1 Tax=Kwoniella dejecticola CBS 10117 TaxID=1296121 RepID=A0A1A6AC00_9TREE|nr:uncharacterized protein I303_01804 [Kwoniella dejecticola CBS 10117]OBR87596.1 hypothetical protein I303_01804 [Kwoniella dejecticola CBS 10117]